MEEHSINKRRICGVRGRFARVSKEGPGRVCRAKAPGQTQRGRRNGPSQPGLSSSPYRLPNKYCEKSRRQSSFARFESSIHPPTPTPLQTVERRHVHGFEIPTQNLPWELNTNWRKKKMLPEGVKLWRLRQQELN